MTTRTLAAVAALLGALSAAGLAVAVSRAGLGTYVSEAGVAGAPHSGLYRASVVGVGVTAALLAAALRRGAPSAALALVAAAPAVALSGSVTCTPGCPLPPYEATTTADLFHAGSSMIGVGCCALAVLALALTGGGPVGWMPRGVLAGRLAGAAIGDWSRPRRAATDHPAPTPGDERPPRDAPTRHAAREPGDGRPPRDAPTRHAAREPGDGTPPRDAVVSPPPLIDGRLGRLSRVALAVVWPLLALTAVSIVAVGRGALTGTLERLGLAACLAWLVAAGALRAATPP